LLSKNALNLNLYPLNANSSNFKNCNNFSGCTNNANKLLSYINLSCIDTNNIEKAYLLVEIIWYKDENSFPKIVCETNPNELTEIEHETLNCNRTNCFDGVNRFVKVDITEMLLFWVTGYRINN